MNLSVLGLWSSVRVPLVLMTIGSGPMVYDSMAIGLRPMNYVTKDPVPMSKGYDLWQVTRPRPRPRTRPRTKDQGPMTKDQGPRTKTKTK